MEGTGSFGAELGRYLRANQIGVIEVDRPDRRARRAAGKSDSIDAYAAATAVLAGRATGIPKSRDGAVEAIRPQPSSSPSSAWPGGTGLTSAFSGAPDCLPQLDDLQKLQLFV